MKVRGSLEGETIGGAINLTGKRLTNNLLESIILLTVTFTPLAGGRATCAGGNAAPGHSAERIREAEDSEAPMNSCSYCYYKKPGNLTWKSTVARMRWRYGVREQI